MNLQASIEQLVAAMNDRIGVITRRESRGGVIPRFNQSKTVACVDASFQVHADLPAELAQGLFARTGQYRAKLRFANATEHDDAKKDIRGVSIKVSGIDGEVLWGEPGTQDFLFNSYPALFAATPEEFLSFIEARQAGKEMRFFLNPTDLHIKSLGIVMKARKRALSPLDIRYWSTVPFRHGVGNERPVKYSLTPVSEYRTRKAVEPGPNQLRAALKAHLQKEPAQFHFSVQWQGDPERMPIDDASVIWNEEASPFIPVATITIDDQNVEACTSDSRCDALAFNPWQSLPAHEPLGRMNAVRRDVYAHGARLRQSASLANVGSVEPDTAAVTPQAAPRAKDTS